MSQSNAAANPKRVLPLVIGAVGVVFGDIGTSPLYTVQQAFSKNYGLAPDPGNVLGVLSLVFWSLILVITVKYVAIIMRADNRGEGGILALMAVVQRSLPIASPLSYSLGLLGIFGTALFFGDGVLTPAISVLSAIEGLGVVAPSLTDYVLPATIVVLVLLFSIQRRGVAGMGKLFGPITVLWFLAIGATGLAQLIKNPSVLQALNPVWALGFFVRHGVVAWLSLGAVVLAVTGGEALYADMGHFGRRPDSAGLAVPGFALPVVELLWTGRADPCRSVRGEQSVLSDGARLGAVADDRAGDDGDRDRFTGVDIGHLFGGAPGYPAWLPAADADHPHFVGRDQPCLYPVGESRPARCGDPGRGRLRLIRRAGHRLRRVRHRHHADQRHPHHRPGIGALAGAGTRLWPVAFVFVAIDLAFLSANLVKFTEGAWFPLLLGVAAFTLMRTWRHGRDLVRQQVNRDSLRIEHFVESVMVDPPLRVPGTAVFLTPSNDYLPPALLHNLKHNQVLHQRNVILTVETLAVPRAEASERVSYSDLGHGFSRLNLRFGYMEDPNVPKALVHWPLPGPPFDPMATTFFASREALSAMAGQGMPLWRDKLFLFISNNATPATEFFSIPGNRLVELGVHVEI